MRRRGFTLIELAMVLSVMGLLVALSVPGYRSIVLRSRSQEARMALEGIADAELRYFRDHGRFVACAPMPAGEIPRGTTALFDAKAPGWRELAFHMEGRVRYRYEVALEGKSFRAVARGDLDGDGKASTFTLRGDTMQLAIEDELE